MSEMKHCRPIVLNNGDMNAMAISEEYGVSRQLANYYCKKTRRTRHDIKVSDIKYVTPQGTFFRKQWIEKTFGSRFLKKDSETNHKGEERDLLDFEKKIIDHKREATISFGFMMDPEGKKTVDIRVPLGAFWDAIKTTIHPIVLPRLLDVDYITAHCFIHRN